MLDIADDYNARGIPQDGGSDQLDVRIVLGPQEAQFSAAGLQTFLHSPYVVTEQSNRQGLRLDGPIIESISGSYDIVSDAVVNGSIQVPGDGKPIILLADRQTTGGYAKIATVASVDLPKLGQARPGTSLRFSVIDVDEAQNLLVERSRRLATAELRPLADNFMVRVEDQEMAVAVAELGDNGSHQIAHIAEINGRAYPISVEEHTPAE